MADCGYFDSLRGSDASSFKAPEWVAELRPETQRQHQCYWRDPDLLPIIPTNLIAVVSHGLPLGGDNIQGRMNRW